MNKINLVITYYKIPPNTIKSLHLFSFFKHVYIIANSQLDLELFNSLKNVTVIQNEINKGISLPVNQVIASIDHDDIIMLLDQDTTFDAKLLPRLVSEVELQNSDLIAPMYVDGEQQMGRGWVINSGMVARQQVFSSVKFDPNIPLDYSDIDFSFRLVNKGFSIKTLSFFVVDHSIGDKKIHTFCNFNFVFTNHNRSRYFNMIFATFRILIKPNIKIFQKYYVFRHTVLVLISAILFDRHS